MAVKITFSLLVAYFPGSPSKANCRSDSQLLNSEISLSGRNFVISEVSILTPFRLGIALGHSKSGLLSLSYESEEVGIARVGKFSRDFPSYLRASISAL